MTTLQKRLMNAALDDFLKSLTANEIEEIRKLDEAGELEEIVANALLNSMARRATAKWLADEARSELSASLRDTARSLAATMGGVTAPSRGLNGSRTEKAGEPVFV